MKKFLFLILIILSLGLAGCKTDKENSVKSFELADYTSDEMVKLSYGKEVTNDLLTKAYSKPGSDAIYASPNGDGDGSIDNPYNLYDALENVSVGQTLYLRGGIYSADDESGYLISKSGTSDSMIRIEAYKNETPIIENNAVGEEAYGIQINKGVSNVMISGLEIRNITSYCAYGIVSYGSISNVIIRDCKIHNIRTNTKHPNTDEDAGANSILLFGEDLTPISDVLIINNSCYNNVNGWSEVISITANCQNIFVISNNVYKNTNIGIDFYGNNADGYCPDPSLNQPRNCLCAGNKISYCKSSYADCAGIYVDGAKDILVQNNYVYKCQYGIEVGSEEKNEYYPVKNIIVRNNIFEGNTVVGIRVGGYDQNTSGIVYDTDFINNTLINNEEEFIIAMVDNIKFINNACSGDGVEYEFEYPYVKNVTIEYCLMNLHFDKYYYDNNVSNRGNIEVDAGLYDYYLNQRVLGIIDIGAVEK